jgi:septum formation protein
MSTDPQIYLASSSPRRQELLLQLGVRFELLRLREAAGRERDVVEGALGGEPPLHYVERIARTKALVACERMASRGLTPRPLLAADTEVVLDDVIFGKPTDAADAARMLRHLSGRTHQVLTAVAVKWRDELEVEISTSAVTFAELGDAQIDRYVATGEPFDKAGAYAIQGRGGAFVRRLDGSYSGVVGLPLAETAAILTRLGLTVL